MGFVARVIEKIALVYYFIWGIGSIGLCMRAVGAETGILGFAIAVLFIPVTVLVAPLYFALTKGNFFLLAVVCLGALVAGILFLAQSGLSKYIDDEDDE